LLAPIARVYAAIADRRLSRPGARAGAPVICIGNPTVGGAGKTPAAIAVASLLLDGGRHPVFLTRGYGGRLAGPLAVDPARHDATDVGDEPLLLARTAPVIVARDRPAGARAALALGADAIVMDDGFQNPSLHKDLSILVVDGRRGVGNGCVIPAGPLRATLGAQLDRAQALLVVGEDAGACEAIAKAGARGLAILRAGIAPRQDAVARLRGRPLLAFCGIGDPQRFAATLTAAGLDVRGARAFPDHHRYTASDAASLLAEAEKRGLTLVTTEKDRVRLERAPELAALKDRAEVLPIRLQPDDVTALQRIVLAAGTR